MMTTRSTFGVGLISISCLLLASLYLQYFSGFVPCPLCTLQRFTFLFLGALFLLGIIIHNNRLGTIVVSLLSMLMAGVGIALSGRQIWLQHFPTSESNECGVSLQYMMEALPLHQVLQKIIAGSAECSARAWEFLGLDMAEWSLLWFVFFFGLSIYLLRKGFLAKS